MIAKWLFTAMAAETLGSMERRGRTGFRFARPVSQGCVRMVNSHIQQLFDAVDVGMRLEIRS